MISDETYSKLAPWFEYYPDEDEEDYDGIHNGGVKGLKKNAPKDIRKLYSDIVKAEEKDNTKIF